MIDERFLIALETIDTSSSISEAAEKLYISQPYLSRRIKSVEKKFGVVLVNRSQQPVSLTPAAYTMMTFMRKGEKLEQQLTNKMKSYANNDLDILRLGITPPLGENLNLFILPKLLAKFPDLRVHVKEISTALAEKAFRDGKLDAFIGNPINEENVITKPIFRSKQVLVINRNSKLYQPEKFKIELNKDQLSTLNGEYLILVDSEERYQNLINDYFNNHGVNFIHRLHVRDSLTALKLAEKGLGDMTISIEAMKGLDNKNAKINYVVLPVKEISILFSFSELKNNKLQEQINFIKELIFKSFRTEILNFKQ